MTGCANRWFRHSAVENILPGQLFSRPVPREQLLSALWQPAADTLLHEPGQALPHQRPLIPSHRHGVMTPRQSAVVARHGKDASVRFFFWVVCIDANTCSDPVLRCRYLRPDQSIFPLVLRLAPGLGKRSSTLSEHTPSLFGCLLPRLVSNAACARTCILLVGHFGVSAGCAVYS